MVKLTSAQTKALDQIKKRGVYIRKDGKAIIDGSGGPTIDRRTINSLVAKELIVFSEIERTRLIAV